MSTAILQSSALDREFDGGSSGSLHTPSSSSKEKPGRRGTPLSLSSNVASLWSSGTQPVSDEFTLERIARDITAVMAGEAENREREIQRALAREKFTINRLNFGEIELYGREQELSVLTDVFQSIIAAAKKEARVGIVMVKGRAGTGKSRLCSELRRKVVSKKGFFLGGKFDLQNRKEPYTGIMTALADLPAQVSALGDEYRSGLCSRLEEAIGGESHILTSLAPGLAPLFPYAAQAGAELRDDKFETRSIRLHYIFRQLIGCICSPDHPVVFVVDDMHWSDTSSLSLLSSLASDKTLSSLLLLATYREEEIHDSHPSITAFEELRDHRNVTLRSISVAGLDQMATHSIVSTALRSSGERTLKLAEIVHQKSNGNAMYTIQFLRSLYEDGLLKFNLGSMSWTWDDLSIQSRSVTDNVVDLTTAKLQRLDPSTREILQVASCLGQTFDERKLKSAMADPGVRELLASSSNGTEMPVAGQSSDLTDCLCKLVEDGVIDYRHQLDSFCFVHDLIQEAASNLIPNEIRAKLHCSVGLCLLQDAESLDDKFFFRAVELSNIGLEGLSDSERMRMSRFNEAAAQKATERACFSSALKYYEEGLRCLGSDPWLTDQALALSLSSGAVEAAFCSGDFETMEARMTSVFSQPIPIEAKVRVYLTRILSYSARELNDLCLATGRQVLIDMGMSTLPMHPGKGHVIIEFLRTKMALRRHTEESLKNLPLLEDKRWFQAMSVVDMMQAVAYCTDQDFFAVMNLRMLRWTLKHGVCRFSPTVFATYGIILCTLNEIDAGQMMGALAMDLSERLDARSSRAKTVICVYDFIVHWKCHVRSILKPLLYGHKLGLQTGEIEIAMYNITNYGYALIATASTPLRGLISRMRSNAKLMRDLGQEGPRSFEVISLQFLIKITYPTDDPVVMNGPWVNEEEFRAKYSGTINTQVMFLDHYSLQLALFFEDYERAERFARLTDNFAQASGGHFYVPRNALLRGLTALIMARKSRRSRLLNMRRAAAITKMLKLWSELGNVNAVHMLQLLQAETAAVKGKRLQAKDLYMSAINSATKNQYLNDKALAHERAFLFHLEGDSADDEFWAENHFKDAVQAYCDWQAYQKAKHLLDRYGHRFVFNSPFKPNLPDILELEDESHFSSSRTLESTT